MSLRVIPCPCGVGQFARQSTMDAQFIIGKNCETCGYQEIDLDRVMMVQRSENEMASDHKVKQMNSLFNSLQKEKKIKRKIWKKWKHKKKIPPNYLKPETYQVYSNKDSMKKAIEAQRAETEFIKRRRGITN